MRKTMLGVVAILGVLAAQTNRTAPAIYITEKCEKSYQMKHF